MKWIRDNWLDDEFDVSGLDETDQTDETDGLNNLMAEEMELLRSEIEFLQNEITVKDQQIAEILSWRCSKCHRNVG